ncbi:flavodoxin, partial [Subdoligranulum variabile]|uniref:flavodoxin n=1 Tax=Subdoligranulum variabile TaxID=214851 RepID=UPI002941ECA9
EKQMREFWSKRVLPLLIAGVLTCSLAGCGNAESASVTSDVSSDIPQTSGQASEMPETTSVPEESENAESDGNNILIAYFTAAENSGVDAIASASYTVVGSQAVGRIRAVADMIQKNVGGDLFSIQTSVVYPADGAELIDYAAQEQEENARPELTTHIENLDQYDTIFIGYPNWWADLPMAVYSFFDEYDFSGKTIIPFNVHNGSRFSRTIQTIEELEPDATVIEDGFTVSEQTVAEADPDVAEWLESLEY